MRTVLVTGGAGFFGRILKRAILEAGDRCVSLDILPDEDRDPRLATFRADLRDPAALDTVFGSAHIDGVIHCAAVLAHGRVDPLDLWTSNVDGTRSLAAAMQRHGVRDLVFTSTNCLWGESVGHAIGEDEPTHPVEIYGRSKLAAEQVLSEFTGLKTVIVRCPTIIDFGRLGLLSILFEFIHDGRRVWTVGGGRNRYQFIYARDLARACTLALDAPHSDVFHVGSDDVKPLREVYEFVIRRSGSRSKVCSLPLAPAIAAMKLAHHLHLSPLGPYHYKMIAEDFLFDTSRIKQRLGWMPTMSNEEMLWRAYQYYSGNRREIASRNNVSAHRQAARMGVIRLLKWVS